jgi:regulator of sirC expression with transglutaminase-like and TPR domain
MCQDTFSVGINHDSDPRTSAFSMTREEARRQFTAIMAREENELELDRATLLIAAEEYPHLEIETYLAQLDLFAQEARQRPDASTDPRARLFSLSDHLFHQLGFRGNEQDYYDARNSFLNDVIDRRIGIPITLSVIYIEVARRLDLPVVGVGMPGHFIVKYQDHEQEIFLDPFQGGRALSEADCREMIGQMYGEALSFHPSLLRAMTKRQIVTRMLQNLKSIYASASAHHKTLAIIERALLINPEAATEIRDRGLVCFRLGRYKQSLADLETYLRRWPRAEDAEAIKERINDLRQRQAQLN